MIVERDPEGAEPAALAQRLPWTGRRVLEIGCGDGRLTFRIAPLAHSVVGFDVEDEIVLEAMQARRDHPEARVHFHVAVAEHLPYPANRFDAAVFAWSF